MDTKSRTNDFANFTRSYMGEEEEKRRKRRVARMYAKQRQVASNAWNGGSRNNLRTHVRTHTRIYVYVRAWKRGRVELKRMGEGDAGYIRLQTALVQRIFRRGAGPGRILRVASFLSRPLSTLAGQKLLLCSGDRVVPHGTSLWN